MVKLVQKNNGVWILTDNIAGNANQARYLDKIMDWKGEEIHLDYSFLSSFPNIIPFGLHRLTDECRKTILTKTPPNIIISSGRRAASIAAAIKNLRPSIKIVQILHPELPLSQFNAIILPQHDKKSNLMNKRNIVWIAGAISYVDQEKLLEEEKKLRDYYDINQELEIYSLMIGGSTRGKSITKDNIDEIMQVIMRYAQPEKVVLIISTSRRTPASIIKQLHGYVNNSRVRIIIYTYNSLDQYNPYWGMIATASRVIITADSISMCSEAVSYGKQVFLYGRKNMLTAKHEKFMQSLIQNDLARNLVFGMRSYKAKTVDQSKKIVQEVTKLVY